MFVEVILPLNLQQNYTYQVPIELEEELAVGKRVVVQFGKKRLYTALIYIIHNIKPLEYTPKPIISVLDDMPIVMVKQLSFWQWISSYYMCSIGEVMNAALPAALKLSSETKVILNPHYNSSDDHLDDKEYLVSEALSIREELTIQEIQKILQQKAVYPTIRSMLDKGMIFIKEELKGKYKPKQEAFVYLAKHIQENEKQLKEVFALLAKAPKQLKLLMTLIHLKSQQKYIKRSELIKKAQIGNGIFNQLVKKDVFEVKMLNVDRIKEESLNISLADQLTPDQQFAFEETKKIFSDKSIALLQGVTSSGKTQVYIELIKEALAEGTQVLYLLPEIALTTQITARLKKVFGEELGIYHSKFNDQERVEIWNKLLKKKYKIILGARSALFLPFENLGLIVVDEEHDPSYKQFDPAPRYNARDSAIYLSTLYNSCKVLLGSATPSLESRYNVDIDKYGLIHLNKRYLDIQMPIVQIVNIAEEKRKNRMKSHFSSTLLDQIKETLANKEQIILFQNRRGYAPFLECMACAWVPQCKYCNVSLTYHKYSNDLRCHYCGYKTEPPDGCHACGNHTVQVQNFGTEKIEDDLSIMMPEVKIGRMDLDTVKSKYGHQKIISNFEEKNIDVLIGTQMVTKGLDFDNVGLVGILNADNLLNYPDFRANERAFQLMTQVSGRAGRKNKRGKVYIQAINVEHPIIKLVKEGHYATFYANELMHRKKFGYAPYYRLIKLTLKHKNKYIVEEAAIKLAQNLKYKLKDSVKGPIEPIINRIRNYYLQELLIKIPREQMYSSIKKDIYQAILKKQGEITTLKINIDVDPN